MNLKKLLAALLALCMLLSCAIAETATETDVADDPVVLRVGEITYTRTDVQGYIDSYIESYVSYYAQYGMTLDPANPELVATVRELVISELTKSAVKTVHAVELGVDDLTEDEQTALQNQYMQYFTYIAYNLFGITDYTTMMMYSSYIQQYVQMYFGVTYSDLYYEALEQKLLDAVTADVTVTDDEVYAAYESAVTSDREGYASTPERYDYYTSNGYTLYYRPEGMRYVKNLLIKFTDEDSAYISALKSAATTQQTAMNTAAAVFPEEESAQLEEMLACVTVELVVVPAADDAAGAVPTYTVTVTDTFEPTEDETVLARQQAARDYAAARAQYEAYTALTAEATDAALAAIAPRADAALARLAAGEDWDTVMAECSEDPGMAADAYGATGYLVYEGISFDPAFMAPAMALENVGDYSDKTPGMYGYYIVQLASIVEAGPVAFEDVRDDAAAQALTAKKQATYDAIVEQWVSEADVELHLELLE